MYCKYCGREISQNDTFCTGCGYSRDGKKKKKKKKGLLALIVVLCVALLAGGVATVLYFNSYDYQVTTGYKLLEKGNYAEAELAFDKAIKIDAKRADAYYGKATSIAHDTNMNMARAEQIVTTLHTGYEKSGDVGLLHHRDEIATILKNNGFANEADWILKTLSERLSEGTGEMRADPTAVGRFQMFTEYQGTIYSGVKNDGSVHVGGGEENTIFCIYKDHIYYFPVSYIDVEDSGNYLEETAIWRTDLDGGNKVCVANFRGDDHDGSAVIGTSNPVITQDKIYLSFRYYDKDTLTPLTEWVTWSKSLQGDVETKNGVATLAGEEQEIICQNGASELLSANERYLLYNTSDDTSWDNNHYLVAYDIQKGSFLEAIDVGDYIGYVYLQGESLYYGCYTDRNHKETYRYNFGSKAKEKVLEQVITEYCDNTGYYVENGTLYAVDLNTFEKTSLVGGFSEYSGTEDATKDVVIVISENSDTYMFDIYKVDLATNTKEMVGTEAFF